MPKQMRRINNSPGVKNRLINPGKSFSSVASFGWIARANPPYVQPSYGLRDVEAVGALLAGDYKNRFEQAMDDDFNTPVALSVLFDIATELNKAKQPKEIERAGQLANNLKKLGDLLGILQNDPDAFLKGKVTHEVVAALVGGGSAITGTAELTRGNSWIEQKILDRSEAKKSKNWALADQIRDELKQQGIILEDKPDSTTSWRRE